MLERVDQLSTPPIPGRRYLVPCVRGRYLVFTRDWPVVGPLHEDRAFFSLAHEHYHLDHRFLYWSLAIRSIAEPMSVTEVSNQGGFPAPIWHDMRCHRSHFLTFPDSKRSQAMQAALGGAQCKRAKSGWICPHRNFHVGSIKPNKHGRIICPLHGLQIDAETGIVPKEQIAAEYSIKDYRKDQYR